MPAIESPGLSLKHLASTAASSIAIPAPCAANGSIACAAGPGGAGCLGLGWWEKSSDYEATVWDLRNGISAGSLTTDVKGTSVMIGAIAPIPLIAPVQSTACDRLAGQLRDFLTSTGDEETAAVSRKR